MTFVQIIEYHTSKPDEVTKLHDEFRAMTDGKRLAGRVMECIDRNDPTRHFTVVEFPSYEEAMENSALPETAAMAEKMMKIADGPPTFYDLDVVRVHED